MSDSTVSEKKTGIDLKQQITFLKKIDFFDNFDNHEIKQFLTVTRWLKVPKNTSIIKENTSERAFYILVKGEVSIVKTVPDNPEPVLLAILTSGACFGEMSLVMDIKRTAGVITSKDSFILMVEPEIINTSNVFLQVKFYKRFCEVLVSRLIVANEKMAVLDTLPSPIRTQDIKELPKEIKKKKKKKSDETLKTKPIVENNSADLSSLHEDTVSLLPPMPEKKDRIVKSAIKRHIKTALELPFNPVIAAKIAPYLYGECENTRMLADIIQLDPLLSSKVMQLANSSFFRRTTPVATVAHALITVGIKQIQEALSETVDTFHNRHKPFGGFKQVAKSFWRHSIIVARIASILTDIIRVNLSTDVYLAGLFHDIGILALDSFEPAFYPHLIDPKSALKKSLSEEELIFIGIDHGQAGSWYGESVGLPPAYLDVIKHHHKPDKAKDNSILVAVVHLADLFAMSRNCGVGDQGYEPEILHSSGWAILQDKHRPFLEVYVPDFIGTFNNELDNTWSGITDGLDF